MESANLLIKLAASDLKSSRILYENKQYRTSYFFFQQAAEKANKALGLLQEIITEEDLFDIQHKQTKIHRKGLTQQDAKIEQFLGAIKQFPEAENHQFLSYFLNPGNEKIGNSKRQTRKGHNRNI